MSDAFDVVRHARARRAKLVFDPVAGRARLVLPRRAALAPALAWARAKSDWIADQAARVPPPRPFAPDAVIPFGDTPLTIRWRPGPSRRIARYGDDLVAEGEPATLARRVEAWLRRESLAVLTRETAEFAGKAGVTIDRVAIGDARGRWGSCSGAGAIRYSWRLILAPGFVRRATAAHEVAHRVHMNHGPAFHALTAHLLGSDPAPARAWLRAHGAGLHWIGRSPPVSES